MSRLSANVPCVRSMLGSVVEVRWRVGRGWSPWIAIDVATSDEADRLLRDYAGRFANWRGVGETRLAGPVAL